MTRSEGLGAGLDIIYCQEGSVLAMAVSAHRMQREVQRGEMHCTGPAGHRTDER